LFCKAQWGLDVSWQMLNMWQWCHLQQKISDGDGVGDGDRETIWCYFERLGVYWDQFWQRIQLWS
jgi:hypothetical protein